jgi:sugar lactone lactonase YvrE
MPESNGRSFDRSPSAAGVAVGIAGRQECGIRRWKRATRCLVLLCAIAACTLTGCFQGGESDGELVNVWGRRGISKGRLQKPRAITIDGNDELYIVDMTARIQAFDLEGNFLRGWQTPAHDIGRPTGISVDRDGNILVADTHYHRVLIYSRQGELLRQIGGTHGLGRGEFGFVTDVAQDSQGNYYISEYGELDRIHKYSRDGKLIKEWGGHGREPGEFLRPQSMVIDEHDQIWVADSCNHRIQVFDTEGNFLRMWGEAGSAPGQLYYPYNILLDGEGHLYAVEYGNHRVQKFTLDGQSLGCWGESGREPGQLFNPWGLVRSSEGRLFVLDTNNHRVQEIRL